MNYAMGQFEVETDDVGIRSLHVRIGREFWFIKFLD